MGNFLLVAVSVVGILLAGNAIVAQDCGRNSRDLILQCEQYVQIDGPQLTPSPGCCDVVKQANVPCLCQKVTKEVEEVISMEKVAFVANYCGRPLQHGMHCGSYTVPTA